MNGTIGYIFHAHSLDEDQEHWPEYIAVTEIAINSTINASINKVAFELLCGEIIPLLIDLLLSRESFINPHAHIFASKMKKLVNKVKSAMYNS